MRIAVMFEEEARYERRKQKETEGAGSGGKTAAGLPQGFEEDFHFGDAPVEDDDDATGEVLYETDERASW